MGGSAERPLALVTGASSGIGHEFCRQLAARGYDLVLVARDAARLAAVAAELEARHGIAAAALPADLSVDADVDRVVARIAAEARLELLVNNAGFGTGGTLRTADPAGQEAMVRVHVLAAMRLAQAAVRAMVPRRRGGIINVASVAGFLHSIGNVNYCATKAYLISFSEGLGVELYGTGVRAQALCPGFTHSEFHARLGFDKRQVPRWMWLDASRVVRESLASLARGGPSVYVPGKRYRALVAVAQLLPRAVRQRIGRRSHQELREPA